MTSRDSEPTAIVAVTVVSEELAAVVRDDAADAADAPGGADAANGPHDAVLVDGDELLEPVPSREPVVDDEDAAVPSGARDDRVALQMPGLGRRDGLGGALLEPAPSDRGPGRMGRILLALVFAPVGQVVVRQPDVAGLDVVVERPQTGQGRVGGLLPDDLPGVEERPMPIRSLDQVADPVRDGLE